MGRSTDSILAEIKYWQCVQRVHAPISTAWKNASDKLKPLFAEMAVRA